MRQKPAADKYSRIAAQKKLSHNGGIETQGGAFFITLPQTLRPVVRKQTAEFPITPWPIKIDRNIRQHILSGPKGRSKTHNADP
jgi:hypothetical protein